MIGGINILNDKFRPVADLKCICEKHNCKKALESTFNRYGHTYFDHWYQHNKTKLVGSEDFQLEFFNEIVPRPQVRKIENNK